MKLSGFASPKGDKAYFFSDGGYVRYDIAADRVEAGYPLSIEDNWHELFPRGIDACVPWNDGTVLFFCGDEYSVYDLGVDTVVAGFPRKVADDWTGLTTPVDAGVLLPSGRAYFFHGDRYQTWDTATDALDGDPAMIVDGWSGLFPSGIDTAFLWPTGALYVFSGDKYVQYDVEADAVLDGYPRSIAENWAGLPFDPSAVVAPSTSTRANGTPARAMSTDEALAELDRLTAAGTIACTRSTQMAGKVDLDGLVPGTSEKQDGNVGGVVICYLGSGTKSGTVSAANAPDRLDPRNALALVRLCQWLAANFGVTELYHAGINGDASGARVDCHGQGRAVDFVGVKGTKDGTEFFLTVNDDWGTVVTPSTPGGTWQPTGTDKTHFRLDDVEGHDFERDFFARLYAFIASEWQDTTSQVEPAAAPSTIGSHGFVMNPDHPTSKPGTKNGREAHQGHLHMQIGVTGPA